MYGSIMDLNLAKYVLFFLRRLMVWLVLRYLYYTIVNCGAFEIEHAEF